MKAILYDKYGPPEVLYIKEIEKPAPKDDEILVKNIATTVSVADTRMRAFRVPPSAWIPARIVLGLTKPKRKILGAEMAGIVETVGTNVNRFKPGDEVFASTSEGHHFGAYAQYKCIKENELVQHKPTNMTLEEAATVPVGGRTALFFLKQAKIQEGDKVLIYGASGSVGTFAVQIAKYYGAEVTGVCSSKNIDWVKSLGADKVIDYKKGDFSKMGEKYDVIFDTLGKIPLTKSLKTLQDDGILLHAVATMSVMFRMQLATIYSRKKCIGGSPSKKDHEDLKTLKKLIENGHLKTVIKRKYPMEYIVEAHHHVDEGHKKGNVVITINHDH